MSLLSGIYFPLFTSIVPVYNVLQHGKYITNPDINKSWFMFSLRPFYFSVADIFNAHRTVYYQSDTTIKSIPFNVEMQHI